MRLSLRPRHPVVIPVELPPPEPVSPGAVRFSTEGTTRRFVPVPITSPKVEIQTLDARLGRAARATLSTHHLPETVSCGSGYLQVLSAFPDGLVINEVRTHGDRVMVAAVPPWTAGPPVVEPRSSR